MAVRKLESSWEPIIRKEVTEDGEVFVATNPAFPFVMVHAETIEEVKEAFQQSLEDALDHYREHGIEIPPRTHKNRLEMTVRFGKESQVFKAENGNTRIVTPPVRNDSDCAFMA